VCSKGHGFCVSKRCSIIYPELYAQGFSKNGRRRDRSSRKKVFANRLNMQMETQLSLLWSTPQIVWSIRDWRGSWQMMTRLGCLWTCGVPRGDVIFHWETSRTTTCLDGSHPHRLPPHAEAPAFSWFQSLNSRSAPASQAKPGSILRCFGSFPPPMATRTPPPVGKHRKE
jgi:hypothetical protein